jgi:hypothetical protein
MIGIDAVHVWSRARHGSEVVWGAAAAVGAVSSGSRQDVLSTLWVPR